jgi:hypothetical protein
MNLFNFRKDPNKDAKLELLEQQLSAVLHPIDPRPEFVSNLRFRLRTREIQAAPALLPRNLSSGLLVAGGVLGSLVMLITSIRGILSLISVISLVFQYFNRNPHNHPATPA